MSSEFIDPFAITPMSEEEQQRVRAALATMQEALAPLRDAIAAGCPLDPATWEQLAEIQRPLAMIRERLEDTIALAEHRLLDYALAYYESVKAAAARGEPGAAEIVADLTACHPFMPNAEAAAADARPPSSPDQLH